MVTLARIFEAWRDAEAFEKPTEGRSFLWHLFKLPQFGLLIFTFFTYFTSMYFLVGVSTFWMAFLFALGILAVDVFIAWMVFEHYLKKFREEMRDGRLVDVLDFARRMASACDNIKSSHVYFLAQQAYEDEDGRMSYEEFEEIWQSIIANSTFMLKDMGIDVKPVQKNPHL